MNLKENTSFIALGVTLTSLFFLSGCIASHSNSSDFNEGNILQDSIYDNPKDVNFGYTLNGTEWTLTTRVYGGLNKYLEGQPRTISYYSDYEIPPSDFDHIIRKLDDKYQMRGLESLVNFIRDSNKTDTEKVAWVVSIVQNIPYDYQAADFNLDNSKYPYEVLYKQKGICSEKSNLLVYLL